MGLKPAMVVLLCQSPYHRDFDKISIWWGRIFTRVILKTAQKVVWFCNRAFSFLRSHGFFLKTPKFSWTLRTFQLLIPSHNTGHAHEPLLACLAQSVSENRQFSTNSRAHFSVCRSGPTGAYLGPCQKIATGGTGDSYYFNLRRHILICFSLNPWCLINLMRRRRRLLYLSHPVTPTKPLGNDGAGHNKSDAERAVTQSNDNAQLGRDQPDKRQANACNE